MASSHILVGATDHAAEPTVRSIAPADLADALKKGWDDFSAMPSHAVFLCVIYPAIGWLVAVGRYRALGAGLAIWMGMLIPWLNVHADFIESRRRGIDYSWTKNRPLPPAPDIEPLPKSSSWKRKDSSRRTFN